MSAPENTKEIVQEMEQYFQEGVPERAIYASPRKENEDTAIPYIKTQLDELRQRGDVYDTDKGLLRTV